VAKRANNQPLAVAVDFNKRFTAVGAVHQIDQSVSWPQRLMMENASLSVEVRDQDIVITMPGTSLRVVYRKPHRGSQLVARLDYFQDQQKGPITRAEFLAKALKLANQEGTRVELDRVRKSPGHTAYIMPMQRKSAASNLRVRLSL
jgi:hypothetical protein